MRKLRFGATCAVCFGSLLVAGVSAGQAFDVVQITNNDVDEGPPVISGSNVVWSASGEIYLWDGSTTTQITDNTDSWPSISGSSVAWRRWDGNDYEIYFWDGSFPVVPMQITDNSVDDYSRPGVSGSTVVWQQCDGSTSPDDCRGGDWEIYFWDGATTIQITNNGVDDTGPAISGSNVVWTHCDGGVKPHCTGGDTEIYLWDGSFPIVPVQITDNDIHDEGTVISGSNVAWRVCDGGTPGTYCENGDWEIYFWDGATTTRITDDDIDNWIGGISGSSIVWYARDGSPDYDYDIYLWDGDTIANISNNSFYDSSPSISGSKVVWIGRDGEYPVDYEVYMATPTAPVPSLSFGGLALLASLLLGSVIWARRGR